VATARVTATTDLVLRRVEIDGRPDQDCLLVDGIVAAIGPGLSAPGARELDGGGGALLPGLADHHLHLFAMAAAAESLDVSDLADVSVLSGQATGAGWLRVVGWHEGQGELDRERLDRLVPRRPVRVQHRSGALWVLNSAALRAALLAGGEPPAGAERNDAGELTGRLWRADAWLRRATAELPDLAAVGARLAAVGVTAVTDATPDLDDAAVTHVAAAVQAGALPQRVQLMTGDGDAVLPGRVTRGPVKIIVADHSLPDPDELAARVRSAHATGRHVAVHCVSRAALALTLSAFRAAGVTSGDRIEHCAVADRPAVMEIAALGVTVVTQPSFVLRRGDSYLDNHDADEHDDLWRFASLTDAGVPTAASSDAPYGDVDPWTTLRCARDRRTVGGRVLAPAERLPVGKALHGLLASLDAPGGTPRRVVEGSPADLVLLASPVASAIAEPSSDLVAVTITEGRVVHRR
jgi:predicted amidohydrolase YtcJ